MSTEVVVLYCTRRLSATHTRLVRRSGPARELTEVLCSREHTAKARLIEIGTLLNYPSSRSTSLLCILSQSRSRHQQGGRGFRGGVSAQEPPR